MKLMKVGPVPWPRPADELDPARIPGLKAEVERRISAGPGTWSVAVDGYTYRAIGRLAPAVQGQILKFERLDDAKEDSAILALRCAALMGHVHPRVPNMAAAYLVEARRQRQRDLLGLPVHSTPARRSLVQAAGWIERQRVAS